MECNKEEAIRAKGIAEKKMQCRDFVGAQKMVLKAQQLFPDLENIPQMLSVCEVHCSAEVKVNGSEDWYGILQVESTADETLIKKQYRKLALLLHPDKNKFAGAEAAFKLVGEAHRTLSDKTKRSFYDLKRNTTIRTVGPKPQPHHASKTSNIRKQAAVPNSYTNHTTPLANLNQNWASQQQQSRGAYASETFWTKCSSCGIRYQYYRTIVNKALRCQNCLKPFIAYDINAQDVPGHQLNQSGAPQHNASQQSNGGCGSSHMDTQQTAGARPTVPEPFTRVFGPGYKNKMEDCSEVEHEADRGNEVKVEKVKLEKANKRERTGQPSGNAHHKRRKKVMVESSDADSTDSEAVFEESEQAAAWNADASVSRYPRRSTRQKQNVAYNEDNSDADDSEKPISFKRLRKNGSSHADSRSDKASYEDDVEEAEVPMYADSVSQNQFEGRNKTIFKEEHAANGNKQDKNCMNESRDLKGKGVTEEISEDGISPISDSNGVLSYPDPEFYDFEKAKDPKCFVFGQIWAIYDNLDGMPRFYARIRSVSSEGFKVRFTWLEHDPVLQAEIDWFNESLPVSCGSFKNGKTENSDDTRMFSHVMSWGKGSKKKSYRIHPRKGEVWALFKGWDIKWSVDPDKHQEYEYEIVEVLSDFAADTGVNVVSLIKVKGFVSLFCRRRGEGVETFHMPPGDLLKFSHMVPSYRMTGKEREGIPEGIFELDTASLPCNMAEMFPTASLDEIRVNMEDAHREGSVPSFVSGTTRMKSSDEFEDHCTFRSSNETNEKIQIEKSLENNQEQKSGQARGSKFPREKTVDERVPSECPKSGRVQHSDAPSTSSNNVMENGDGSVQDPLRFVYPDSEFYSFNLERSKEKFQPGQIWALYNEGEGFPNYYALVRKVDSRDFKIRITWLEASPVSREEIRWARRNLPSSCGRFKLCTGKGSKETYDELETFSHLVHARHVGNGQYDIYPQVKEVWALYGNWSADWRLSDLKDCSEKGSYEVVEVVSNSGSVIVVLFLEKVEGFKSVFRPRRRNNGSPTTMEMIRDRFLQFSHQIPSFRLTEERGGKLRGHWELDPAALPDILLCSSSD